MVGPVVPCLTSTVFAEQAPFLNKINRLAVVRSRRQPIPFLNMRAATKRRLAKYWGYILVIALYFAWFEIHTAPAVIEVISLAIVGYCLLQAPVPCCAETRRGEFCRYNAKGLLRGCHLESHKWQNVKMLIRRQSWAGLARGIFRQVSGNAATLSAVAGCVSALAAAATLVLKL